MDNEDKQLRERIARKCAGAGVDVKDEGGALVAERVGVEAAERLSKEYPGCVGYGVVLRAMREGEPLGGGLEFPEGPLSIEALLRTLDATVMYMDMKGLPDKPLHAGWEILPGLASMRALHQATKVAIKCLERDLALAGASHLATEDLQ